MAITRHITNSADVKAAIKELELKVKVQETGIQSQFADVKHNLQPHRVMRNTFSYLAEQPEVQKVIVNTAIGFIIGFASKKAVEYLGEKSLNSTIENMVGHHLNKLENENPDSFVARGIGLLKKFTPPDSPIYPFLKS